MPKEELKGKKKTLKEGQRNPSGPDFCSGAASGTVQINFLIALSFGGQEGAVKARARRWLQVSGRNYCLLALHNRRVCCAESPWAAGTGLSGVMG